ncbi:MAG: nucleotidyl transferase AbiEii/AbiGii toxin family protein [Chloroflexota bacterium]
MTILHWQTITPEMRQVMATIARSAIGAHFYLAGGTALALQLGHRRSADLDYFSQSGDIPALREPLRQALEPLGSVLADSAWGNLVFLSAGVRTGFYGYVYDLIQTPVEVEGTRLASVTDIALMKLDALLGRAGRKDFHDLYAICQRQPLRSLLDLGPRKYPRVRDFEAQVVKRLVYFERAEQDEPPPLLEPAGWETVKAFFQHQAADIGQNWIE